ncbi:hypothetical protein PIB30_004510 [Stylosanthes scabra]|uniref:Uncharacterized protein n=1 Tax=Stylosanthes scabra TaxID=79078 RepID=A0ABU6X148_9FABA|nr:hypothetical protein [Stylosanthes scabra]
MGLLMIIFTSSDNVWRYDPVSGSYMMGPSVSHSYFFDRPMAVPFMSPLFDPLNPFGDGTGFPVPIGDGTGLPVMIEVPLFPTGFRPQPPPPVFRPQAPPGFGGPPAPEVGQQPPPHVPQQPPPADGDQVAPPAYEDISGPERELSDITGSNSITDDNGHTGPQST